MDNNFILPPTPEDYRRMWEAEHQQKQEASKRLSAEQAKRQAIREVLRDEVKRRTTPNPRLNDAFNSQVNKALKGR